MTEYMYVCMNICMYVRIYVGMHVRMHLCIYGKWVYLVQISSI